jgi:hypothetical protein
MQQNSPGHSSYRKHNRGASMTQSKSPGGIGFLSKQYKAVVKQNAGASTRSAPISPSTQSSAAVIKLEPMPITSIMNGGASNSNNLFIQNSRDVLGKRRSNNTYAPNTSVLHEQWCNDYDRLLLETEKVFTAYIQANEQANSSTINVNEKVRDQKSKDLSEIASLNGKIAQLEASLKSHQTLLKDEKERAEVLRKERNEARKVELLALDNEVRKAECEKLAARVASLESDNAVLLAEKAQWFNNLESENKHLQELYEEAKNAKDVMVRELNAIDEERTKLAEQSEELQRLIQQKKTSNVL